MTPAGTQRPQRTAGFTLLEVLVALVLVSGLGMALFSWVNTNLTAITRVEDAAARDELTLTGLEFLSTVNPMETPTGELELPPYRLQWSATALKDPIRGVSTAGGLGYYMIALYEIECRIFHNRRELGAFSTRQIGYRQIISRLETFQP